MGHQGQLAQRALETTMPVLYHARRRQEAEDRFNARYCDLDTLLRRLILSA